MFIPRTLPLFNSHFATYNLPKRAKVKRPSGVQLPLNNKFVNFISHLARDARTTAHTNAGHRGGSGANKTFRPLHKHGRALQRGLQFNFRSSVRCPIRGYGPANIKT